MTQALVTNRIVQSVTRIRSAGVQGVGVAVINAGW